MSTDPESLYGIARPRRRPEQEISSSTSETFSTKLTSLLAQNRRTGLVGAGRPRPIRDIKTKKDDIFTAHRSKKRNVKEILDKGPGQSHQTQETIGGVDEAVLKRSKRKLEEKARLYASMKRGDYVDSKRHYANDEDRGPLVDFDRKWAEAQGEDVSSDSDVDALDEGAADDRELVEYTDEFGRLRKASRAQIAQEERRQRIHDNAVNELEEMSARPKIPDKLIYGDTVQASAFNPDAAIERQMEELAARRDRSLTPPEETHYDASKEIRSKGVGFYKFSNEEERRKAEMQTLGESRKQTERWEEERRQNRARREQEMDESRRRERERKSEREANAFLKTLGTSLGGFVASSDVPDAQPTKKKRGWGK